MPRNGDQASFSYKLNKDTWPVTKNRATRGLFLIFCILESGYLAPTLVLSAAYILKNLLGVGLLAFIFLCVSLPVGFILGGCILMIVMSYKAQDGKGDWTPFMEFKTKSLATTWAGKKLPVLEFVEWYINGEIDLKTDLLTVFLNRSHIFRMAFSMMAVKHYVKTFTAQWFHDKEADKGDIAHVYDRGNDFYNWFLGETMVYTSGIFLDENETLEVAEHRKLDTVCRYVHMKKGDKHLDIGCGWGTLLRWAAANFGTHSTGVTLSAEQKKWGEKQAADYKVSDRIRILVRDYRDLPKNEVYDKITCLEMAEHVGIKNFQDFLHQVKAMLKDDGMFYLQIAGLRRAWQYEDLVWGIFMGKYIFPGADASCPLGFVVTQLERAGFEVHRVENCGVHYSLTIKNWWKNWQKNKSKVLQTKKYGKWWWRLWDVFLAWSTIIAGQGSSTVFMITCHKNTALDRDTVADPKTEKPSDVAFSRLRSFVGKDTIATQP